MSDITPVTIHTLTPDDVPVMHALLTVFGEVFDEADIYGDERPGDAYLTRLLGDDHFIALAALEDDAVIGGLAAYVLPKFERERSEVYIYDLAVLAGHRRKGVATALIRSLKPIAVSRGAWVIFVQADHGDAPAAALYSKLGKREHVLHFDIRPD